VAMWDIQHHVMGGSIGPRITGPSQQIRGSPQKLKNIQGPLSLFTNGTNAT